jgi:hypothetical protein
MHGAKVENFQGMFEISSYKLGPCPLFLPGKRKKNTSIGKVKGKDKAFPNKL